ncbi:MAG: lysine 2,3-aminomutase [Chloroflexi bacterium]|nr:MAG: lysine 2,3-aminomutase [Chloroflexota bacterium]
MAGGADSVREIESEEPPGPQPFRYPPAQPFTEPDWRRLPGFRNVTSAEWESARWQRLHSIRDVRGLREVFGTRLSDDLAEDIAQDALQRATMTMLVPPQMLNTMDERDLRADPVRRYMLPAVSERCAEFPSHPYAMRDSLHEAEMWAVEGLTHRYPTKVLAEVVATCPQYCGHCTRMDLVGPSTAQVNKYAFRTRWAERELAILDYLRDTPSVRDVVVSGGDIANVPIARLEAFVMALMDIEHIRDIRLASKSLVALPQHFLQQDVLEALARTAYVLEFDFRDVRNQAVLLRGVNATPEDLLALCFRLLDGARITPYYAYMCDMVPNTEHWRTPLWEAQQLQSGIMGYLPGYATPRVVCDVPMLGKVWVHQVSDYDRELGISQWTKNYLTPLDARSSDALDRRFRYYDPIHTLPESGQAWWRRADRRELVSR